MLFVDYLISLDKKAKGMVFPKIFSSKQVYHAFRFYANRLHSWYMCIESSGFYEKMLSSNYMHKIFFSVVMEFIITLLKLRKQISIKNNSEIFFLKLNMIKLVLIGRLLGW